MAGIYLGNRRAKTFKGWRVSAGQKAAVCGLVIAGLSLTKASAIVGVPYVVMKAYIPFGWYKKKVCRRRWNDLDELDEIKEAWLDIHQRTKTIAARYGVSPSLLRWLANREGWPKRRKGNPPDPDSARNLPPAGFKVYRKLLPIIGRQAALDEARRAC